MKTWMLPTLLLAFIGCRDRGQGEAGTEWAGTPVTERLQLRPSDQEWQETLRAGGLLTETDEEEDQQAPLDIETPVVESDGGIDAQPLPTLDPDSRDGLVQAAQTALTENRATDALIALRKASSKNPNDTHVQTLLGRTLARLKRHSAAAEVYSKILVRTPKHVDALYGRALANMTQGQLKEAQPDLELLAEIRPDEPRVQRLIAQLTRQDQSAAKAFKTAKTAPKANPEPQPTKGSESEHQAQLKLGTDLGLAGKYGAAEQALNRAIELDPSSERAWRNLASVHEHQKDYPAAIEAWQGLLKSTSVQDRQRILTRIERLRSAQKSPTGDQAGGD